jgi:hypothetical protein
MIHVVVGNNYLTTFGSMEAQLDLAQLNGGQRDYIIPTSHLGYIFRSDPIDGNNN